MKLLTALLSLSISITAHSAQLCQENFQQIGAIYQITENRPGYHKQQTLEIWRTPKQVIYSYPKQNISEQWRLLDNQQLQFTRYFEQYQRGIEYQPADMPNIGQEGKLWLSKYQLVSQNLLQQLQKLQTSNTGCAENIAYQSKAGAKKEIALNWNPHYQLPTKLTIQEGKHLIVWQMQALITDPQQLQLNQDKRDRYKLTDYSDIGDSESDPFLAKMINQGFIEHSHGGFYNADGQQM